METSFLRQVISISLVTLAILLANGAIAPLRAQDMPKAVVAVLDYAKILRTSDAAKDINRQINQYRSAFREEIQTEEIRLRKVEAELKRQRLVLSPEALAERRKAFKDEVIAVQKRGQERKRQLDRAYKSAMDKVQSAMIPIVKRLTQDKGYTIVVDKSQVLFANRTLDVTDDVMSQLNEVLRSVAVPKPE